MYFRPWRLLPLLASCASLAFPQTPKSLPPIDAPRIKSIDNFVASEMARQKIPGLALGIYSRGTILLAKGYGQANVELNVPVKPETVFQSGSVGKQFVSAAIMMLVEEGKISLDDSITKYFPEAPPSWKPILIKNLLSHTSGLSEYEDDERTGPKGPFYLRLDFTEDELVSKIEALPIEWPAGSKWDYRNTNYVLLGVIIHKVTGKFYADYLGERIFKPLGMSSTRLISEADIIPNRSAGYELHDGQLKNQSWVSPTFDSTADGALYFNVLDLAKWDAALYTTQLLKQTSLDRVWTVYLLNDGKPNPAGYGFAWSIGEQNHHKRIEHGGAWQGFTTAISRYPDDNLTVVVLTNLDAGHSDPELIAHVVAGLVIPALLPAKLAAIPDNDPQIAAKVASILDQIVAGTDLRPQATPGLAARMTPETVARAAQRLKSLWPDGALTLVKHETAPGGQPRLHLPTAQRRGRSADHLRSRCRRQNLDARPRSGPRIRVATCQRAITPAPTLPAILRIRPVSSVLNSDQRYDVGSEKDYMSQYAYHCQDCDKEFTQHHHISDVDKAEVKCPHCGGKNVHQLVSAFSAVTSKKS